MNAYRAALLAAAGCIVSAAPAWAQATTPSPRPLPPGLTQSGGTVMMQPVADGSTADDPTSGPSPERRPSLIHALSPADHDLYDKAFDAGDRGDWTAARGLADQGHDPIARRIVIWRYLTAKHGGAGFEEIARFLREHPDWPLRRILFIRAEQAMPATLPSSTVLAWFGDRKPATGIGAIRLGEALLAGGRRDEGRAMIRTAWITGSFDVDQELEIIRRHGDILTPAVDAQRLDRLIWRGDLAAARRELSRVDSQTQRLAQVRMALRTNPKAGERMLAGLPQTLKNNPGVIFDSARVLRRSGGSDAVPDLLVKAPTRQMARIDPGHWWGELSIAARQAMKDGSYATAYRLVSDTGLDAGTQFADAEFMAGWIALRYLHDPAKALAHFRQLAAGVTRPISLGRAHYWTGRAYEALGNVAAAVHAYRLAAKNPQTFYGQLALTRLQPKPRLHLKNSRTDIARVRTAYEKDELTRAIRILADLGEERFLRLFAVHAVEVHPDAGHIALLASDLVRLGFRDVAVRVAKSASYNGIDLLDYSHPLIALPGYRGPGAAPDRALVLGLIRQETEFNADAVSRVGARGIMQLMPSTARRMARLAGLPYRRAHLTTDTHYNIQLGMTELSTDLSDWNGSYILAAAAYNAGGGNVRKWIATYGDPRSAGVDPIDWIEQIPYSETRNYVQRVIENTEVYRNRLAGRSQPLRILADLYRPNRPPHREALRVPAQLTPLPAAHMPPPTDVPRPAFRPDRASTDDVQEAVTTETAALEEANEPAAATYPATPIPRPGEDAVVKPKKRPVR